MKKWITQIGGQEITEAFDNIHLQYKTTKETDERIVARILEKASELEHKKQKPVPGRFLLAAAVLFFLLIPAVILVLYLRPGGTLRLLQTEGQVICKENNIVVPLVPGDKIGKGYEITTRTESLCTMQYDRKATITVKQESGISVPVFSKSKITLSMDYGEILIDEKIDKCMRIEVQTPNALVYAIGTRYSVAYNKPNRETVVKTFEGIVFVVTTFNKEYTLQAGEDITIKDNEATDIKETALFNKELLKEWRIQPVYYNTGIKEPVIGFDTHEEFIAAVTERSIVCFTYDEILWEYVFDIPCVTAAPTIYNGKVYVPTIRSIPVFALRSGDREDEINLIDSMRTGHTIIHYKNKLYTTLASGIYVYNVTSGVMDDFPLIPLIEPVLPVFYKNSIFLASYITNNAEAYDLTGHRLWSLALDAGSSCAPLVTGDFIFIATNNGTFYKISTEGEPVKQIQLNKRIMAIKRGGKQNIFIHTEEKTLFALNFNTLAIEETYRNVNTAVIDNKNVITGKTNGAIEITGIYTGIKSNIPMPGSPPFSFICREGVIFTGLENGSIMRLEYKQVNK